LFAIDLGCDQNVTDCVRGQMSTRFPEEDNMPDDNPVDVITNDGSTAVSGRTLMYDR
jgi:hypothetical protein